MNFWDALGLETGAEKANRLLAQGKKCKCYNLSAKFEHYDVRKGKKSSGINAKFKIEAKPTNAAGCACDCTDVRVIQFVQTKGVTLTDFRHRRSEGKGWRVDAGDEFGGQPFLSDTSSGRAKGLTGDVEDPAGMFDLKGAFNSGSLEAYTCLMCVEGGKDTGAIIGCVKWGFKARKQRSPEPGQRSFPTGSILVDLSDPELTCGVPKDVGDAIRKWNDASEENKIGPQLNRRK